MKIATCSFIIFSLLITGCTSLILKPVDFSWPVEVVLKPDKNGNVEEARYQSTFNVKALLYEEFQDSTNVTKHALHVLRDQDGFYFITAKGFKNVYVFAHSDDGLKLKKKIPVSEKGLVAPAFNQKTPYIHLISETENIPPIVLTKDGIVQGEKK